MRALSRGVFRLARRASTQSSTRPTLVSAQPAPYSGIVSLQWSDGRTHEFHSFWLRDNCCSRRNHLQKHDSAASIPEDLKADFATCAGSNALRVTWLPDGHESTFCGRWLRSMADHETMAEGATATGPATTEGARASRAGDAFAPQPLEPAVLQYDELRQAGTDAASWAWISALAERGAALVQGVPCEEGSVAEVAELIGPVQQQIYGATWDVRLQRGRGGAINAAYTDAALPAHMDLCYYESPPGLQLLHCLRFDDDIDGGKTFLVDAFAAAEQLRAEDASAFHTLAELPATFVKDHSQREQPVLLSYHRPHISLTRDGTLVGVFWAPPWEGALRLRAAEVPAYYSAYKAFHRVIERAPRWERRLSPGELLIFNNRRLLHGRHAFRATGQGARWLRGCYVSVEDFANRYNLLRREHGEEGHHAPLAPPLGNQDWCRGVTGTPVSTVRANH